MRNKFTLVVIAITIAITGMFATHTAEAAKRKVVLEDHTGAWCGYCTRGMETLEKLEAQYGEQMIGVGVHNGDGMAIASYQGPLASGIGLGGYPNGSVNRVVSGNKIAQSDNMWAPMTQQMINTDVPVGVTLDVDYNKVTGDYTATITAIVESAINAPLSFNLWAIEDYMKGTGQQWDQRNYLSASGGAPSPSSKFYNFPDPILGFEHNNVFRGATGGLWGDVEGFPTGGTTPAGTYTKTYTGNVRALNVENSLNAYFVAVVSNVTTKEILNADRVGKPNYKKESMAPTLSIDQAEFYKFVPNNETKVFKIGVTNNNNVQATHNLSIHPSSIIPAGWDVDYNPTTLAANGSGEYEITVNPNNKPGFAVIVVRAYAQIADSKNWTAQNNFFSLSAATEKAYFSSADPSANLILSEINQISSLNTLGIIPITPAQLASLEPNAAKLFKTVIYTIDEGNSIGFAPTQANFVANMTAINNMTANGTDILISSSLDLMSYGKSASLNTLYFASAAATDWFKNKIGVDFGLDSNLLINNTLYGIEMKGIANDEISNGLAFNFNGAYNPSTYPFYATRAASMSLNGYTDAVAFLEGSNPSGRFNTQNNKFGVRIDKKGQRTIFLGITVDAIAFPQRSTLFSKMITWLEGEGAVQADGPKIALSVTKLSFGEVKVGEKSSQSVTVNNTGDEKLTITAANLKSGLSFVVKAGTLPLNIDAGQTVTITVDFTPPSDKAYSDELTLVSNDPEKPNSVVTMNGLGVMGTTSVPGVISDLFEMTVTPNPIVDNSVVNFNVKKSANVSIELIDATGRVINQLFDGVTTGANVGLNAAQLSSGTYYINANVDDKNTQIPVVITK